jgi:hypothetical protein
MPLVQDKHYWDELPILSIFDMISDGAIAPDIADTLQFVVPARRRDLLAASFMPERNVDEFWEMMRLTRSVVTGSAAVLFWKGMRHFEPGDLDIATNIDNGDVVVGWFKSRLGWEQVAESHHKYGRGGASTLGVERTIQLRRHGKYVDIIISKGSSALLSIANFWSTILLNFVSADGAYCAYPDQFRTYRGLVRQSQQWEDIRDTHLLIQKYDSRGMDHVFTIMEWTERYGDTCTDRWTCPVEWRRFGDEGGFLCWFAPGNDLAEHSHLVLCDIPVVWRLGGDKCLGSFDGGRSLQPICGNVAGGESGKVFEISERLKEEAREWCESLENRRLDGYLVNRRIESYLEE